jgi:hypothetical protein
VLFILVSLLTAAPSPAVTCLPVPDAVVALGDTAVAQYRASLKPDAKAPSASGAPASAQLLLRLIWSAAGKKDPLKALDPFMARTFTWSFGGDAIAEQALTEWAKDDAVPTTIRAAIAGRCTTRGTSVTCAPAKGPRLVLEKQDGCWRWTAFVGGD